MLPFLVTILFGTIDGARAFATWNRVKNGAHEGAQFAQYFPLRQVPNAGNCAAPNNIQSRVQQEGTDLTVVVTPTASPSCQDMTPSTSMQPGQSITVRAEAPFSFISPIARALWKNTTIEAEVTVTVQG